MADWNLARLLMGKSTKTRVCEISWVVDELKALRASACLAVANPIGGAKFNHWRQKRMMLSQSPPTSVTVKFRGYELRVVGAFDKLSPLRIEYTPENLQVVLKVCLVRGTQPVCVCVYVCVYARPYWSTSLSGSEGEHGYSHLVIRFTDHTICCFCSSHMGKYKNGILAAEVAIAIWTHLKLV